MVLTRMNEFEINGVQERPTASDLNAVIDTLNGQLVLGEFTAGDTLGTVVGGIEVFAADGETSLGFVPVYDAITEEA